MKKIIDFLGALRQNNNREWFEAHKAEYREALARFNAMAEELMAAMATVDPAVAGLKLSDCTYRIYRDTRFSADKTPYKTHMGVYVCPYGKKSGYAGYYLHVEPAGGGFTGNSLLAAGLYMPSPEVLRSVRDEIFDNGEALEKALARADGFVLDHSNKLTRVPKGYPADSPWAEWLKLKDFSVYKPIDEKFLLAPGMVGRAVAELGKTAELNGLLNRAVSYTREQSRENTI